MNLEGKIVDFLGDSITEGCGVQDIALNRYDNIIKREYNLKEVYNYGIGGSRIAHQRKASACPREDLCFCGRAYNINPEADLIVVYGGINDHLHGDAPVGQIGDTTPETFCGGVDYLMRLLLERHPNAKVAFLTPAKYAWGAGDYRYPSEDPRKDNNAQPVRFYCDVIIETAKKYGIPVLDMYNELPIDPLDEEANKKYMADGLHFNDEGHKILAEKIAKFLLSL